MLLNVVGEITQERRYNSVWWFSPHLQGLGLSSFPRRVSVRCRGEYTGEEILIKYSRSPPYEPESLLQILLSVRCSMSGRICRRGVFF